MSTNTQTIVSACDNVPAANETVAVSVPPLTSGVAAMRSGRTGITGVNVTPLRITGVITVSPTGSVTLPVKLGDETPTEVGLEELLQASPARTIAIAATGIARFIAPHYTIGDRDPAQHRLALTALYCAA